MMIRLHETFVTFTKESGSKISKTVKITQLWERVINGSEGKKKAECPLENNQKIWRVEQFHWENGWNIRGQNVWQSTQHDCENRSTTSQMKVLKWRVCLETVENVTGTLCNSYTGTLEQFHRENDRKTIEKCVPHNVITRMGSKCPKRKQQCRMYTFKRWLNFSYSYKKSGTLPPREWIKIKNKAR